MAQKLQTFFGDDLEETFDSLLSAPGAFGNIIIGLIRQVRLIDGVVLAAMFAGWAWLIYSVVSGNNPSAPMIGLALLPTITWVVCGIIGGLIFEVAGVGWRSLAYWESYLLMVVFITGGVLSLRIAINPRDRRIVRAPEEPAAAQE